MQQMCTRLTNALDTLNLSDRELAQVLGYANASTLSRVRRGEAFVDVERLERLSRFSAARGQHLDLNWIITGSGTDWLAPEPRLSPLSTSRIAKILGRKHPAFAQLIFQADNAAVLGALAKTWPKSVRCAYLDPPYNNGDQYTHYSDATDSTTWRSRMRQVLTAVHATLTDDGSVWVSIDDTEVHYLKVMMDQVYGRGNFVASIIWERRTSRENRRAFSTNHEYLLVYAKNRKQWAAKRNPLPPSAEILGRYRNPDSDPRGPWQSVTATAQAGHGVPSQFYTITAPNGLQHDPPKGRCWVYAKDRMEREILEGRIWFGQEGRSVPRLKKYLNERKTGVSPSTIWSANEVGTTASAKKHLLSLFPDIETFDTPKPEHLIARILEISTDPGELVLDPFLGSGTTAAVAHKLGRSYVGVEIGSHAETHCAERLQRVIEGETGGVSRKMHWKGGGNFEFHRIGD